MLLLIIALGRVQGHRRHGTYRPAHAVVAAGKHRVVKVTAPTGQCLERPALQRDAGALGGGDGLHVFGPLFADARQFAACNNGTLRVKDADGAVRRLLELQYNILISDIYMRAKELHVAAETARGVFVVRPVDERLETVPVDVIQGLYPDRQNDFVISVGEQDVALIHQMDENATAKDLEAVAQRIEEALRIDGESCVFVGIGTLALHLRDLAKSYKEAQIAIEVGKVFDTERYVINYENLGIGRLIYQLPTTLCEMFLQEVFKKNPIDALDQETLFTIYKFFENNLNVSETARKLFVHRNTLVYRLEKIKKLTGLDLREFDDAITFKVALMVKKYLTSRGIDS